MFSFYNKNLTILNLVELESGNRWYLDWHAVAGLAMLAGTSVAKPCAWERSKAVSAVTAALGGFGAWGGRQAPKCKKINILLYCNIAQCAKVGIVRTVRKLGER
jgi:hypothetical protein